MFGEYDAAEMVIGRLCEVPLEQWRAAARASLDESSLGPSDTTLDPIRRWWLDDDLAVAFQRLDAIEPAERLRVRAATREVIYAIANASSAEERRSPRVAAFLRCLLASAPVAS